MSLIHPDGSGLRTLSTPPVDRDGLAWSPDPKRLRLTYKSADVAHSSSSRGPAPQRTFVRIYDLATATETPVAEVSRVYATDPTWSPDGTRIAWWDDGNSTVAVADALAGIGEPIAVFQDVRCGSTEAADPRPSGSSAGRPPGHRTVDGCSGWASAAPRSCSADRTAADRPIAITLAQPSDTLGAAWQAVAP